MLNSYNPWASVNLVLTTLHVSCYIYTIILGTDFKHFRQKKPPVHAYG